MNKLLLILATFASLAAAAQETLSPLSFNPNLYHSAKKHIPQNHKYLVASDTVIVATDTLSLPFSDDFSTNRLRSYKWLENHITDTFYRVFGTCLGPEGIPTISQRFMLDTAWSYSYDTTTHTVDSTALPPLKFTFFGPSTSGCFAQAPQTFYYWQEYYTYRFDSAGRVLDSTLVNDGAHPSDTIAYAPVILFAADEPGTLWFDNYAYVNNTYPVLPPTIGVATLDGLNQYGLPYDNHSELTYGDADKLTTKPINLAGLSEADSVYLSFFFEGKGLGDFPDLDDSLIVEFKDNGGFWRKVWWHRGYQVLDSVPNEFEQVLVKVPNLPAPYSYFHNTFQFRFRNKASLYGSLDHWHIDYVRFDKNRSSVDTIIQDIAFQYPFPTLLKNYTLLPADQFGGVADLADTILLPVRNLDPNAITNPPATNFVKGTAELYPLQATVAADVLQTFNAEPYSFISLFPSSEMTIPNTIFPVDSLVFLSKAWIEPNDSRPQNDTLYRVQQFSNVMAYDDGSAESAYGLTGTQIHKFAYEFNLNHPDTLLGFQIMYAQVEQNVSNLVFNLNIWDSLKLHDFTFEDSPILTLDNKRPYYVDSTNGFTTYVLDTPMLVAHKIYLGWAQSDTRSLQIGYDLNSPLGRSHMFVFSNAQWAPTTITTAGSPMIRLLLGSSYGGYSTAIRESANENTDIMLYPNPTSGNVSLQTGTRHIVAAEVFNLVGARVKAMPVTDHFFSIKDIPDGMYLIQLRDKSGALFYRQLIKTTP